MALVITCIQRSSVEANTYDFTLSDRKCQFVTRVARIPIFRRHRLRQMSGIQLHAIALQVFLLTVVGNLSVSSQLVARGSDVVRQRLMSSQTLAKSIPEPAGTLLPGKHLSHLRVVRNFYSIGVVDSQHL